jgi:hypothetical protein
MARLLCAKGRSSRHTPGRFSPDTRGCVNTICARSAAHSRFRAKRRRRQLSARHLLVFVQLGHLAGDPVHLLSRGAGRRLSWGRLPRDQQSGNESVATVSSTQLAPGSRGRRRCGQRPSANAGRPARGAPRSVSLQAPPAGGGRRGSAGSSWSSRSRQAHPQAARAPSR